MKKVAISLTSIPQSGGEHQYLILLMECLAKCNKKYFDVLAVCYNRFWILWCRKHHVDYVRCEQKDYSCKTMRMNARFPLFYKWRNKFREPLGKVISDNKVDLLISGQQSIFIPQLFCNIIQPVHDLMHRYEPDFPEIQESYEKRETLFCSGARIADLVLVDSKLGRQQYLDCYYDKRKYNPKVVVLPFVSSICGKKEEPIEVVPKYVFYPAQFWEHKNHLNLLLAISILKSKIPNIHLVLVGSERNYLQHINEIIQEKVLQDNVSILGFVSDEQMIYLYKHAVALVMPSYFGPTNIPPLEAMALGCPVIVSDKYAMREQVGEAGLLCNPDSPESIAECIDQVWNDLELRQAMIQKGYEQTGRWSGKDFKKRFAQIVLRELGD